MRNVFVICLLLFIGETAAAQQPLGQENKQMNFNYLSVNNGLSQNSVTSILQDAKGFIWIGTYDGLNRFDGFNTVNKRHQSGNRNSLTANRILCLAQSKGGLILIGTEGGGLNTFNPLTNKFSEIGFSSRPPRFVNISTIAEDVNNHIWVADNNLLAILTLDEKGKSKVIEIDFPESVTINKLICDKGGNIWIATNSGLFIWKQTGNYNFKFDDLMKIAQVGELPVTSLYEDKKSNVWVGGDGKLFRLRFNNIRFSDSINVKDFSRKVLGNIQEEQILDVKEDFSGNIWICIRNSGIVRIKINSLEGIESIKSYNTHQPFCNISDNNISCLYIDSSNTLWAGSFENGINYTDLESKNFFSLKVLESKEFGPFGYKGKFISALTEDDSNMLIGTSGEGLYAYQQESGSIFKYDEFKSDFVTTLFTDRYKTVWMGSNRGLYTISYNKNGKPKTKTILRDIVPRSISEDKKGNIWIATWGKIIIYSPLKKTFNTLTTKDGLSSNLIYTICQDSFDNVMWAGTIGGGLNRIDYHISNKYNIKSFQYPGNTKSVSINSNHIWCIYQDAKSNLWIGTDAGLNKITKSSDSSFTITRVTNQLLKDLKIVAILEDSTGNLWLSSSRGLYRYNTVSNEVKRYTAKDGLQSNAFTEAAFKNRHGILYFGGINGLNYFRPEIISSNPYMPKSALIDFKIFNRSIYPGAIVNDQVILKSDINSTTSVRLSHKQNNFLLTFAALHYALPEDNRFRYKMEGYDKGWIETDGTQRFAAYSNLYPGTYKFNLISSNNDGIWSKEIKTINFIIEPAPWETYWAKILYFIFLSIVAYVIFKYYRIRYHLKNRLFREKVEKEKLIELNEIKLNFFTNITHELRTPLNLIFGPIQELLNKSEDYDDFLKLRIELIHRNTFRLFNLINQVLDLRKISSENYDLMITQCELVQTVSVVKTSFDFLAKQKKIYYNFSYPLNKIKAWLDKEKIEKILFNLLSNAFKHTPENGKINVQLLLKDKNVEIKIYDSGPGISDNEKEKIFEMYYRSQNQNNLGTGIGLALARNLIELHQGTLTVESTLGKGSVFTIGFSIDSNTYKKNEVNPEPLESEVIEDNQLLTNEDIRGLKITGKQKRNVLIVEDDNDQREYIKDCLKDEFSIREFAEGEEALIYAAKHQPDIVITDWMMSNMTGIDFCRKMKSNFKTSHIPIIIHSVKSNEEAYRESLKAGADDFIAKPFDYGMMSAKINNILQSRSRLLNNNYLEQLTKPAEIIVPAVDEELLKKILKIIENNMSDPDFGVERICREIAISRMHLHRRLFAITGKTASEFIREVKMKRAGQLLSSGSIRISEVMWEVGISNNAHFNKSFKEMYNKTPKEYIKDSLSNVT